MIKGPASDFAIQMYSDQKSEVHFPSRYEFLKGHNGLRPNCLIGLLGTSGSGKSTLLKCIITEASEGKRVLVWLSEESVMEYQELIQYLDKRVLRNIVFVEEKEIPGEFKESHQEFTEYFEQMVDEAEVDIVFIDNMTSSAFYNSRFGFRGQNKTAEFLSSFVKRKCAVFYVAHTSANITDNYNKVINTEDIRGSKELTIVTEYLYIIQKFTTNDKIYNVLRVAKYRHHEGAAGWFALKYEARSYVGDSKVPFELINKIFKSRDYLGRASPKTKAKVEDPTPRGES
jgi:energy-coupling factor transporter ATP-binding protein EcfA2